MTDDGPKQPHATAVSELEALGLSTYAARTFVALVRLGEGTAEDVSTVADVPRTRVYDAAEELQAEGLVDVQQSTPKRFWAISTDTTGRHFQRAYTERVERLTAALEDLDTAPRIAEQRGVWTVTGRDTVTERVVDFVEGATDEVVFMTVEDLLTDPVVAALRAASERGVAIRLADMSGSVEADLSAAVPGAGRFDSAWSWSDTPAGRLLMVDRDRTLVSVLVDGDGDHPPKPRDETAIWGSGDANGLVIVLRAMFTWQLTEEYD